MRSQFGVALTWLSTATAGLVQAGTSVRGGAGAPDLRLCARIELDVPVGAHYVEVTGSESGVGPDPREAESS